MGNMVELVTNLDNKEDRILRLEPKHRAHTMYYLHGEEDKLQGELVRDLIFYPHCLHDDGPDSLEMCIRDFSYGETWGQEIVDEAYEILDRHGNQRKVPNWKIV